MSGKRVAIGLVVVIAVAAALIFVLRRGPTAPDAAAIAINNRGVGLMGQYEYNQAVDLFQVCLVGPVGGRLVGGVDALDELTCADQALENTFHLTDRPACAIHYFVLRDRT